MIYRFGVFEFDSESRDLTKNGRAVALEPQPARALALLLSRPGAVVTREELRDAVWGQDTHVDFDRGLAYCVSQIRNALGDSGENPRVVQPVPRKGFKFIAPVSGESGESGESSESSDTGAAGATGAHNGKVGLGLAFVVLAILALAFALGDETPASGHVVIGVSIFDNETGMPEYDRLVAGLSDLVVERLTKLDQQRIAVVGNAAVLRQPRNVRNLKTVADNLKADYVLLGQLQKGEDGLRFITHFIRLRDEAHLKANRLTMAGGGVEGLEEAVVAEFERATRDHVLNRPVN